MVFGYLPEDLSTGEETGVCIITSSQLNWLIEGLEFDRLDVSNPIPNRVII